MGINHNQSENIYQTLVPLSRIAGFITKGATPTTFGFGWQDSGVIFLRSECVSEEGLDMKMSMFISEEANTLMKRSECTKNDILITITGNVGRVIQLGETIERVNINQHIAKIRINNDTISSKYVYHYLSQKKIRDYYSTITTGQAYPQISLKQVRDTLIPLPGFDEQQAIATALSDADALIASLESLIAKKRAIKQGAMQQLLTGRKRLPGFEGEWKEKRLGDVVDLHKQTILPKSQPTILFSHFSLPAFDLDQSPAIETGMQIESMKYTVPESAVLLSKLNPRIPRVWLPKITKNIFPICSTEFLVIVPRSDILRDFLFRAIAAPSFCDQMELAATGTTGSHQRVSPKTALSLFITLPPEPTQRAIAAVLSDIDEEIAALEKRLFKARLLKQGMMQVLLTGQIRLVDQVGAP